MSEPSRYAHEASDRFYNGGELLSDIIQSAIDAAMAEKDREIESQGRWIGQLKREAQEKDAALAEERELRIMQLAAISTASIQNTETTIKDRIDPENPYYSMAYGDTCRAVDREMEHRAEIERLKTLDALNGRYLSERDNQIADLKTALVEKDATKTCLHHTDEERMMAARGCPCCAVKEIHRLEHTLDQRDERIDQMWMILKELRHCGPTFNEFTKPSVGKCWDDCPACARDRLQETLHD